MPRPAKFSEDLILDAATAVVARHGTGATIAQVATELGAPVGSLYYRFASREALMSASGCAASGGSSRVCSLRPPRRTRIAR